MNRRGFTLIEMIITIGVMGILLAIASLRFRSINDNAGIEKEARELRANITAVRMAAMQNGQITALFFGPKSFIQKTYTSLNQNVTASGTLVGTTSYTTTSNNSYIVQRPKGVALDSAVDCVQFDTRGFTTANCANSYNLTLVVTPVSYSGGNNCIVVETARTTIGRMANVSTCSVR